MTNGHPPNLFSVVKLYRGFVVGLIALALASNGLNLVLPKLMASGIDAFSAGTFVARRFIIEFLVLALLVFVFSFLQSMLQSYAAERVAKDLREQVAAKISLQRYAEIQTLTPAKLLTNLTSDIDAMKGFVSQAIVTMISSVFIIIGSSALLLMIDWELALAVLMIIPAIAGTFFVVFGKVRVLFMKAQGIIDWLNKVINESILGAALIRVLNSQQPEYEKFLAANTDARNTGFKILNLFATMIPIITFVAGMGTIVILALGGKFVIAGDMSLGSLAAFYSYLGLLIFPILMVGFMSSMIAQASASYLRVSEILNIKEIAHGGTVKEDLRGEIALKSVTVQYGDKFALKDVSFAMKGGTKNAIIGPTAAGKSQLLYLLTALIEPTSGVIEFDGKNVHEYEKTSLHHQIGFVFQDSVIFNLSVRENIAFSQTVTDADLAKAIETAELQDFIAALPQGLDTVVSERGTSLSGGQKQRIMLARALALNPRILLLDDFTARVDTETERRILQNIERNYSGITLLSVTQKIASIERYDQIILLMEGEVLATGTHEELMDRSPEYVQIADSQRSTSHYELHAE